MGRGPKYSYDDNNNYIIRVREIRNYKQGDTQPQTTRKKSRNGIRCIFPLCSNLVGLFFGLIINLLLIFYHFGFIFSSCVKPAAIPACPRPVSFGGANIYFLFYLLLGLQLQFLVQKKIRGQEKIIRKSKGIHDLFSRSVCKKKNTE